MCFQHQMPWVLLMDLCNNLEPQWRRNTNPVPSHLHTLSALRLLVTGSFQRVIWDRSGFSVFFDRVLPRVLKAIHIIEPQYISFPDTADQQVEIKSTISVVAPNIIGAVYCTHIGLKAPSPDPFPFLKQKLYHSVNVQIISNANCHPLNVVAHWPGRSHDSWWRIEPWGCVRLKQLVETGGWWVDDLWF